jgi:hypothetical protein
MYISRKVFMNLPLKLYVIRKYFTEGPQQLCQWILKFMNIQECFHEFTTQIVFNQDMFNMFQV